MPSRAAVKSTDAAMSTPQGNRFNLNGNEYDINALPAEGQRLLALLGEAQKELESLETRATLIQSARQQLISELKPLLPVPCTNKPAGAVGILGHASDQIPTTPVNEPSDELASFPDNLPEEIRAKP